MKENNISLCNNKEYIFNHNRSTFKTELIMLLFPKVIFKYFKSGCVEGMMGLIGPTFDKLKSSLSEDASFTTEDFVTILKDVPIGFVGVVKECVKDVPLSNFYEMLVSLGKKLDIINYVEAATNLSLLIRDGYLSDMNESENRHFYDNISFNDLYSFNASDIFEGAPKDSFLYSTSVYEKSFTYKFERGNLKTILSKDQSEVLATGLPFKITRNYGDASYGEETIYSLSGILKTTLKMGKEDSQIKVEPAFRNSGLTPDIINLKLNIIIPEFNIPGPYCEGDEVANLPLVSINGITGTWSPEINNTVTTEYTFTPDEDQNAETVKFTITIQSKTVPVFNVQKSYSKGASIPDLPILSDNEIPGAWQPEINNQETTAYTFTPSEELCASATTLIITIEQEETNSLTDPRDGKEYRTEKIGNQIWMAENLAYLPQVDKANAFSTSDTHYFVYDYNGNDVAEAKKTLNFQKYGVLYNWTAAITACPDGWRLPTNDDWDKLAAYIAEEEYSENGITLRQDNGSWSSVGNHLKEDGLNKYGFSGNYAGTIIYTAGYGFFSDLDRFGYWWSNDSRELTADFWKISSSGSWLNVDSDPKSKAFSVRCIKE